jgi:TrmH family RNA methyltransferase
METGMKLTRQQRTMLRSLDTRKGRDETGLFLVEGVRLCEELLQAGLPVEMAVLAEGAGADERRAAVAAGFAARGVPVLETPPGDFERISDTVTSQGILAAAMWADRRVSSLRFGPRAVAVALDGVSDPGNAGVMIRTAAWFGASAVLLGCGCADLLNPKTVRSTMGGIFHLPICRDVVLSDALPRLKEQGFSIVATTMTGSPDWRSWSAAPRSVLLLGSEARGVSQQLLRLADRQVTIPRRGAGESLNVAVSAGILLAATESWR